MNFLTRRDKFLRIVATLAMLSQQFLFAPLSHCSQVNAHDGAVVVGGNASIVHQGTTLDITTQTDRTVINWNSFNIDAGHTMNFNQPGINSAVLNRVITPNNPSAIFGNLNSNGNVYLVNPSGVIVGSSGVINTNGFTASVLDISTNEFMQGGVLNFRGDSNASIINQGKIYTGTGGTTLIGGTVINEGLIESNGGSINLLTGGSVTLKGGGVYTQADQATLINGISETSGLIKNSGTLRATGALEVGGEVYLVSPGGTVIQEAIIAASKNEAGGNVVVDAGEGQATVSGRIDVQGETGGTVTVTGKQVELQDAMIDASGENGGGTINIGGGFQGNDASIINSQSTFIDANSILKADAGVSGDGGTVIIWSDGATDYFGTVSNRGSQIGAGGFTEVSGKASLNFAGLVDTGGGDLLLDPFTYTIDATAAGNILTALGTNNVTIQTTTDVAGFGSSGNNADAGDIIVNANIFWDSPNSLTMLAHRDVRFNASIQNRNATGGDLNLIAGWDGVTPFNTATFLNADVTNTTLFGNNNGSVFIGDGSQTTGIAVASRNGSNNVFAYDVNLQAGNGAGSDGRFAQLGFQISDGVALGGFDLDPGSADGANVIVNGGITVHSINDVTAIGGETSEFNYVQIGSVGAELDLIGNSNAEANSFGVIELAVGRDITFTAGKGSRAYAQLGNGGAFVYGRQGWEITISQVNDITFSSGEGFQAYSQLGQGGIAASGNKSGVITIMQANDILFVAGKGVQSYALLGRGGAFVDGSLNGAITIAQANNVIFMAGSGDSSFAQLGIGGASSNGYKGGAITITQANNITFLAGSGDSSYAHLGNGGASSTGLHRGAITISNANSISFKSGDGLQSYAQLGNGGLGSSGNQRGEIDVVLDGNLTMIGNNSLGQYALIGHDDDSSRDNAGGDIVLQVGGDAKVEFGWIGHLLGPGGKKNDGDMTLEAKGNITLSNLMNTGSYSTINTYSYIAGGNITFKGSLQNRKGATGDINIVAGWDGSTAFNINDFVTADVTSTTLFGNNGGSVFIGDGAQTSGVAVGSRGGNTNVFAYDVKLQAGNGAGLKGRFSQLGFQVTDGIALGGFDLDLGSTTGNNVKIKGDIIVHTINDVIATGGDTSNASYVQIGHVGADLNFNNIAEAFVDSEIELEVGRDIVFTAGDGGGAYAQLGQGGLKADGNQNGKITIIRARDINFSSGEGNTAYAQLGQGGQRASGNHSGEITIAHVNNITFVGGNNTLSYVQLGHGGYLASAIGDHSGAITITEANDITFAAGGGLISYAFLGHGGFLAKAFKGGNITITQANNITFSAGSGRFSFAQLGLGGMGSDGNHNGSIDVTLDGNLILSGADISERYVLIGHGDDPGDGDAGNIVRGDINLRVGGSATLTNAFIGHLIDTDGTYASGKTRIAIGAGNFTGNNTTDQLVTDSNSQFFSAPTANGGELRFYLPRGNSFQAADGTKLNGVDVATFTSSLPNLQGTFQPFNGPYSINAVDGNFAFYLSVIVDLIVNANNGTSTYGNTPINPGLDLVSGTLLSGDTLASIGLTNNFSLTASSNAGIYTLSVDATNIDPSYTLIGSTSGTFTINPAALTITATAQNKVYGDLFTFTGNEFNATGLKNGDAINTVALNSLGRPVLADAGTYDINATAITSSTSFDAANYNITFGTLVNGFTVNPADLTITPIDVTKEITNLIVLDGTTGFTTSGLKNSETVNSVTLASTGTPADALVGTYSIFASNPLGSLDVNNYNITFAEGTLTVEPRSALVNVDNLTQDTFSRYQNYFDSADSLVKPTGPGNINWIGLPGSPGEEEEDSSPIEEGTIPFEIRINSLQASN